MIEIFENYDVKKHSSFKIGGTVKKAAFPADIEELVSLLKTEEYDYVLGNCSNVLFYSGAIDKKIIFTEKISSWSVNGCRVHVLCGAKGPVLSNECRKKSLSGFEFLIGFPGSFGGMISMNASAHNQAVSDCIVSVCVYEPVSKSILNIPKDELDFKYRESNVSKKHYTVLSADFELKKGVQEQIDELMQRNISYRKEHQPSLAYPNAGSIFKNPENDSAGRLLDLCGLKGEKQGGAQVFDRHANFIINTGNASSEDVLTLMYKMYSKVREKYTMVLKPEIKYIGNEGTLEAKLWKIITENSI